MGLRNTLKWQNLQKTLENGSDATFTHPISGDVLSIEEKIDNGIGWAQVTQITNSDNTRRNAKTISIDTISNDSSKTERDISTSFVDYTAPLSTTEGGFNEVTILQITNDLDETSGTIIEKKPTPKIGIDVIIEHPKKEVSGTYRIATLDDISNESQKNNKTTSEINEILSPKEGETYYNTTLHKICFYNGSSWQQVVTINM